MKIAVIGAGISGLTFAAALQRFSPDIQVELYEAVFVELPSETRVSR